ncbi:MAG: tRNA pseudouridine(13) synthase TruD [Candidatus Hydrothermarchaeota archaeon]
MISMYDEFVGMRKHLIGCNLRGTMREKCSDFIVIELFQGKPVTELEFSGKGEYTAFVLKKENIDTQNAIREISRKLKISNKRFRFAGNKDKRAVTFQLVTVYGIEPSQLLSIRVPNIEILNPQKTEKPIKMGSLSGNRFKININCFENPEEKLKYFEDRINEIGGVPNFFGIQRFGSKRPITHMVGKMIVKGDFSSAVDWYLGHPFETESESSIEARKVYDETKDYKKCLKLFPNHLRYERIILEHLAKHPRDFVGALRRLPRPLLRLFVHAYQSYLFNLILSKRIDEKLPIVESLEGDISKNNLPTGVLFGHDVPLAGGKMGEIEREIIEKEYLRREDFLIKSMPELSSPGLRRELALVVKGFEYDILNGKVEIRFDLPKGVYATSFLRELMERIN